MIKFKFHLKNGKVFECVEEIDDKTLQGIVEICKTAMEGDISGFLRFPDCVIRLSDVSVVEWEEL